MTEPFTAPEHLPAWARLQDHARRLAAVPVSALLRTDPRRFDDFSLSCGPLLADFSRQHIDRAALEALLALATESRLQEGIAALFEGAHLNHTEDRAVLHMALRGGCAAPAADVPLLAETAARMRALAGRLRNGQYPGSQGRPIRHVVNIGIGGSDLGPRMAVEALAGPAGRQPVTVRFVANFDPNELDEALADADPAETLFIVSSKSFSTAETLANAAAARHWLRAGLGQDADLGAHFVAVTNATAAASAFGIAPERLFAMPEWVGGRFSVWSAIGLPLLIAIGEHAFDAFLGGAREMDLHFRNSAPAHNLPLLSALIGLWNTDFLQHETLAVLPYAHGLRNFPAWLQQLEMESNGKRTLRDGSTTAVATAPIIWGGAGTVGQHAFHQLLYQGTRALSVDFIVPIGADDPRQRALIDNALAQAAALTHGRDLATARTSLQARGMDADTVARLAPHLVIPGNQPSTTVLLPALDAAALGALMALYEHKVFVQGWIWGINSFDQYGVELGKDMARRLAEQADGERDASTAGLQAAIARQRAGAHMPQP